MRHLCPGAWRPSFIPTPGQRDSERQCGREKISAAVTRASQNQGGGHSPGPTWKPLAGDKLSCPPSHAARGGPGYHEKGMKAPAGKPDLALAGKS